MYSTYAPDIFAGDPAPLTAFDPAHAGKFNIGEWFGKHGKEVTRGIVDSFIKGIQEKGITVYGATGYCMTLVRS